VKKDLGTPASKKILAHRENTTLGYNDAVYFDDSWETFPLQKSGLADFALF
jgi:hypothetical protein